MTTLGESNTDPGILDELAERLGNFHESARALADCLHTVSRQTDLSMIEAATHMYHKLLEKASNDLERVTPQPRESLHAEATRDKHRCPRPETSRAEILTGRPLSRFETQVEESRSHSETSSSCTVELESAPKTRSSRESLEQIVAGDFRKQPKLSVPLYKI